jgi:uncharacterized protein (DUF1778 family)
MDVPLRIMLTADMDKLIRRAAESHGADISAWARPILLEAARDRIATRAKSRKERA